MDFTEFTAGSDDSGRRLDKILRKFLSEEKLSSIFKSLRKGLIKVNGKKCQGNERIEEGDQIKIADFLLQNPPATSKKSSSLPKEIIVLRNESLLILNKPYDLSVQPSSTSKISLSQMVEEDFEALNKAQSLSFKSGPLHRLDRKTTGLLAFSQNLQGARWFSSAIKNHSIQKTYLALLEGNLCKKEIWEDQISKEDSQDSAFKTVKITAGQGKSAYTQVTPLSHSTFMGKELTLAEVFIKTGRSHQIRSQSSFHGYPLLGDTAYGGSKIDGKLYGQDFFLHAWKLAFPKDNPLNLPESIYAPLPAAFQNFLSSTLKIPLSSLIM
ncbi:MAG: RluA family pseudouridine synthase [Treponema sp.]|nr:RluA family pseudouridine synthase [Treponema sp.]